MRAIQTYILRLLVDSEASRHLRGSLQALTEPQTRPFADEQALLDVLHTLVDENACAGQALSPQETGNTAR
jgi:hypothetical protein